MPFTAVGKIFKPELKILETEAALRDALNDAGVRIVRLSVTTDQSVGTRVDVAVPQGDEEAARRVLGQFSFDFRVGSG